MQINADDFPSTLAKLCTSTYSSFLRNSPSHVTYGISSVVREKIGQGQDKKCELHGVVLIDGAVERYKEVE